VEEKGHGEVVGLAQGTRLGHYEILSQIGEGGMGEVYKARDTRLDRTVAVKVIGAGLGGDPTMRERLFREARAASSLNHPHICTVYDVGDGDRPFIAMEWIDGESLAQRLTSAPLSIAELLHLATQVADALDVAHASGIVHRDLKPANLFVTRRGDAKILDFGLARMNIAAQAAVSADQVTVAGERALTNRGEAVGTVSYMAPEQARGDRVDARSDLFSFGVVLYEMATGRSAFAGPTAALTFDAILNRHPPASRTVNTAIPPALDAIIARLLAKDPAGRYQSAKAVQGELQAILQAVRREQSSGRSRIAPSIAVLPFTNLSPEAENEYIADGITEEIINTLAQIKGLQVAARTSSFAFKGKTPDLADVAAKLHVAHVLTGSVRKAGARLRVTVQMVNAHDGLAVWSERYDRQADDIFQIQDEIAAAIAEKLRVSLMETPGDVAAKRGTDNLEAYELYLKGRFFVNQRGSAIARGLECYERAIALDPNYGPAHGGLAVAVALLGFYGYAPAYEAMPKARRAAHSAIASGYALAEAHAVLQFISFCYDWDWTQSEREFALATALNDKLPIAYGWHLLYLAAHGRFAEAIAAGQHVVDNDPLSALAHAMHSFGLAYAGRVDEALAAGRRVEQLDPQVWIGDYAIAAAMCGQGRIDEAISVGERCVGKSDRHPWPLMTLSVAYRLSGRHHDACGIADELIERERQGYIAPLPIAQALASAERSEEAVVFFMRAYREHDSLPLWNHWPAPPPLFATDRRFRDIMVRVGLEPGPRFKR
jgi:serine/threonine protein kinase